MVLRDVLLLDTEDLFLVGACGLSVPLETVRASPALHEDGDGLTRKEWELDARFVVDPLNGAALGHHSDL